MCPLQVVRQRANLIAISYNPSALTWQRPPSPSYRSAAPPTGKNFFSILKSFIMRLLSIVNIPAPSPPQRSSQSAPPTKHTAFHLPQNPSLDTIPANFTFKVWRSNNLTTEDASRSDDWLLSPRANAAFKRQPAHVPSSAQPWLTALVLITFDLEKGQTVEACFPSQALSTAELDTVCNHAMPDSASIQAAAEDAFFSFRVPRRTYSSEPRPEHASANSKELLLAHSFFRQTPDPSNARGSFQKSLVLITSTPYITLPSVVLSLLGPKAFVHGETVLQKAYDCMTTWPDPRRQSLSHTVHLPLLGESIYSKIPKSFLSSFSAPSANVYPPPDMSIGHESSLLSVSGEGDSTETDPSSLFDVSTTSHPGATYPSNTHSWPMCSVSTESTAPIFNEIDPAAALRGVHDHIQTLWEILALGEPLLVYAPTPTDCSSAVMALLSLLHPLPFTGDWRPYLSLHDADFDRISNCTDVSELFPRGAIFGVTNGLLVDTLGFPHVLHLPSGNPALKSGKARLETAYRPALYLSRTVRQAASHAMTVRPPSASHATAVQTFRTAVETRITRALLSAFARYVSMPADGGSLRGDPFARRMRPPSLDEATFPVAGDLRATAVVTAFRRAPGWRTRARAFYREFVMGPVFLAWWRAARLRVETDCSSVRRSLVLDACARRCALARSGAYVAEVDAPDFARRVRRELEETDERDYEVLRGLSSLLKVLAGGSSSSTLKRTSS